MSDQALDAATANPFDATQREVTILTLPDPTVLPLTDRPTLADRFVANFEAAHRTGTLWGAAVDATLPDSMSHRSAFDTRWAFIREWETLPEAAMALAGQIGGTMTGPENYIPFVVGARLLVRFGESVAARVFAGATDAALLNALTDAGIQGMDYAGGRRDAFSLTEWATSVGLGALVGGGAGGILPAYKPKGSPKGELDAAPPGLAAPARPEAGAPGTGPESVHAGAVEEVPHSAPDGASDLAPERAAQDGTGAEVPVPSKDDVHPSIDRPPTIGEQLQHEAEARAQGADVETVKASGLDWAGDDLDRLASRLAPEGHPLAREVARWISEAPSADVAARREAALAGRLDDVVEVSDTFGPVLRGYEGRWADAVTRLEELGGGEARGVLSHPDLGAIDAPWGFWDAAADKGMGIAKIIGKHPGILADVPQVIADGRVTIGPTRAVIETDGAKVVLRLDHDGQRKIWLLTAYETSRRAGGTPESPGGLQAGSHSSPASPTHETLAEADGGVTVDGGARDVGRQERPIPPRRPERLVEFLGRRGGLRDEGGELSVMDAGRIFIPRGGPLVRRTGMTLDRARELAAQAGYFSPDFGPPDVARGTTSVRDFLDLLDRDLRSKDVYRQADADADALAQWEAARAASDRGHDLKRLVRGLDEDADFGGLDAPTKRRMAELIHDERLSADEALERVALEDYYAGHDTPIRRGSEALDDIPFDPPDQRPGDPLNRRSASQRDSDGGASPRSGGERAGAAPEDGAEFPGDRQLPGEDGDPTRAASALAGGSQRAAGGTVAGNNPGSAAATGSAAFTRLKDLAEKLRDLIGVAAVRQGRMKVRGAEGTYDFGSGALRLARQDDFDTFTHEVGHAVQALFGGLKGVGPDDLLPLMRAHASELEALAYVGAKPAHKLEEGFAEFFRLYLTTAQGRTAAPNFAVDFERLVDRVQPGMLPALHEVREAYRAWIAMPSGRAVESTIVSATRPGWWKRQADSVRRYGLGATIAENMHGAYTAIFDALHPVQRAVRGLAALAAEHRGGPIDLKVIDDAYKLARLSRNAHGAGHMDLMHGVVPYGGVTPSSPALRDAIIEAMGAPNVLGRWDEGLAQKFGAYLWSRRALGEWERFDAGEIPRPPDKLTRGDHELHVRESEAANPHFVAAADKVHAWALALWEKKRAAGLITAEEHAQGLAIKDYVPGLRAFDYDGDPMGAGGRSGNARSGFVQRFRGSNRDVINPLESLMTDAYETAAAIARNDVFKALDRLALRAGHGGGAIAERIPAREMRVLLSDTLEVIEAAGKQAGLAQADVIAMRDMVEAVIGDEPARIFRPAVVNTKGETIVFFRDGGELRALRLADRDFGLSMYKALTAMSPPEKNLFLNVASLSSSALRAGVTSDPAFALANLIRDQMMASVFYGAPFKRLVGTVRGMADEVLGREAAQRYNAAGGIMGGQEVAALRTGAVERDLEALRNKGWLAQRFRHSNPAEWLRGLAEVSEISETGLRLGLFKTFVQEARARGLTEWEAVMEGAWRARDHLDFGRRGSQMTVVSRLVPFLNATLQGFDKVSRQMIAPGFGPAVTVQEALAKGEAAKAWARLAALSVAGLGLHVLMKDHEDYEELSPTTRATHWMVKTGKYWTAIPKPFEMAVVLNAAEAVWDAFADKDPLAASRYKDGLFSVLAPPNLFEGLPILKFYYEAKSNMDMFTGRPIVPPALEGLEPWMQYTASTSMLSRVLGKAVNVPPVLIDQFMTTQFGTLGRSAMALSDMAMGDKPDQGWDEFFLTRRFVKSAARGSASSSRFWELISSHTGQFAGAARSYRAMMDGGDLAGAADYLASLDRDRRAYVTAEMMPAEVQRLHPLNRARNAVRAIANLRRQISTNTVRDADGNGVSVSSADRGAADDILADLAMAEARNALIAVGEKGWAGRRIIPTDGYSRELEAVSPALHRILADRYATASVWARETVERLWPQVRQRLLEDGSTAWMGDLAGEAKAGGPELSGVRLKRRPKPQVPGLSGRDG